MAALVYSVVDSKLTYLWFLKLLLPYVPLLPALFPTVNEPKTPML